MKYITILLVSLLLLPSGPVYSQEQAASIPAPPDEGEKASLPGKAEKSIDAVVNEVIAGTADDASRTIAEFSVIDSDILAWEESAEGHYLFIALTDSKNSELSEIASANKGKPLQISLGDNYYFISAITDTFAQHQGFVLPMADGKRIEMIRLLDRSRQRDATTPIDLSAFASPAVTEVSADAKAKAD